MRITLAGEDVHLLPARAIWWPGGQAIIAADPHFGKAAAFRASGMPVPDSAMTRDLDRLSDVIESTGAARVVVLGDFLHARAGRTPSTLRALGAWRARHRRLELLLVRGNHDRQAGDPPSDLDIQTVDGPHHYGPFLLLHEPDEMREPAEAGYRLAGHVHPVAVLRDRTGGRLRLPCFHQQRAGMTLPAFGVFTGGARIAARPGDHVYVVGPDSVIEAVIESDEMVAAATNLAPG